MQHQAPQGLKQTQHDATVTLVSTETLSHVLHEKVSEDCKMLTKMELRRRYSHENNAHRNMLARARANGVPVNPDFREFDRFLRIMGPMPAGRATIDRIDNDDLEYAPGKVRWADKHTQNNNKSDTLIFNRSATGETFTASRLAKMQGVTNSTIRKRRERGWTDDEVIAGSRNQPPAPQQVSKLIVRQFPAGLYPEKALALLAMPEGKLPDACYIPFYRDAHLYQTYRDDGEEYFPALYDQWIENNCKEEDPHGFKLPGASERSEGGLAKLWHGFKKHCYFDGLTSAQKQFVEKIDPDFVHKWKERHAQPQLLKY